MKLLKTVQSFYCFMLYTVYETISGLSKIKFEQWTKDDVFGVIYAIITQK